MCESVHLETTVQFMDMWCVKFDSRDINYAINQKG